jgi:hypothetical protein
MRAKAERGRYASGYEVRELRSSAFDVNVTLES